MKWILFLGLATIIGTAVVFSQSAHGPRGWAAPTTHHATTSQPPEKNSQRLIFATGVVEGARRETRLHFEIDGRLTSVEVREGDAVRQGQVLARLDSSVWRTKLHEAEQRLLLAQAQKERLMNAARNETRAVAWAEVQVAEVEVAETQNELRRAEFLWSRRAISEEEYEDRRHAYKRAQANVALARARAAEVSAPARVDDVRVADAQISLAEAEVQQTRTMLEKTELTAPISGIVLRVNGEPGQVVGPNESQPLLILADFSEARIRAYVEEFDALSVKPGQAVWVTADGLPDRRFHGTVSACHPYLAPKHVRHHKPGERVDVKVREIVISLEQSDELLIGLPVDVFIDPETPSGPGRPIDRSYESKRRADELTTIKRREMAYAN